MIDIKNSTLAQRIYADISRDVDSSASARRNGHGGSMKKTCFWVVGCLIASWLGTVSVLAAAAPGAALLKAKKTAEANGFVFYADHDEIVSRAKKEGKLLVFSGQDTKSLKAVTEAFKKKYPFIDVRSNGIDGTEVYSRMLQEMKAGLAKWDVNYVAFDFYNDYLTLQKNFDILGMAEQGVLTMSPNMVDPVNRHIVSLQSNIQVAALTRSLSLRTKSQILGRTSSSRNSRTENLQRT